MRIRIAGVAPHPFLLPLLVAGGVHLLALFLFLDPSLTGDMQEYHRLAISMLRDGGYLTAQGLPTAYRPVGYPLFVALCYELICCRACVVQLVQVFLSVFNLYLAGLVARRVGGQPLAVAVLWVGALLPWHGLYAVALYPATLFITLQWGTLLLLLQALKRPAGSRNVVTFFAVGLLGGAAALVKAWGLALVPLLLFLALALARDRRRVLFWLLIALVVQLVVISPWLVRNRQVMGTLALSTNGGQNLFVGNGPQATGGYVDTDPPMPLGEANGEAQNSRQWGRRAMEYALDHPAGTLSLIPRKWAYLLHTDIGVLAELRNDTPGFDYQREVARIPLALKLLFWGLHGLFLLAAWTGWWVGWRHVGERLRGKPRTKSLLAGDAYTWLAIAALVLFQLAVVAVFFGAPRFFHVLRPLLMLPAALLLAPGVSTLQTLNGLQKRSKAVFWLGAFLLGLFVLVDGYLLAFG